MNANLLRESIEKQASFTFARSGGPGGQNVNKVNTKVFISIPIQSLEGISGEEKDRIIDRLTGRLIDGILSFPVDEERYQLRNREIALSRAFALLSAAAKHVKKRIPTKPGKAAKLERLKSKKLHSSIKKFRSGSFSD
jgi:ribosome-associated protein